MSNSQNCFIRFKESTDSYTLPNRFTFPFNYSPHPLCLLASKELQERLKQLTLNHDFGLNNQKKGPSSGKMFGVLVVQNKLNQLGYLAAFSGKLTGKNDTSGFVPSIFDLAKNGDFLTHGMQELKVINNEIEVLLNSPEMTERRLMLENENSIFEKESIVHKKELEKLRAYRQIRIKKAAEELSPKLFQLFLKSIKKEEAKEKFETKSFSNNWKIRLNNLEKRPNMTLIEINFLKEKRKKKSTDLQKKLFEQYHFSNQKGVSKNLNEIFKNTPPVSGAGECAAPKLLQYAFKHQLKIVAMAEFWWGKSRKSKAMKHKHFYPACTDKCLPILNFMLEGVKMNR